MRAFFWVGLLVALVMVGVSHPSVHAHHSSAPFYDAEQEIEVIGVVERFVFRNPHSFLYVEADNEDGDSVVWGNRDGRFRIDDASRVDPKHHRGWG